MMNKLILAIFLITYHIFVWGQQKTTYQYPVHKGKKTLLTGNVGEIRGSHFHAGLDIALKVNTKVYAAEDGYLSLIRISSYGYGKVLIITHPKTNQKTLYAHLNAFSDKIAKVVTKEQKTEKTFEVNYTPAAKEIFVKKGELIAFSGNTGHSGGPHLHFEIRTLDDISLNPAKMGFEEIPNDSKPPILLECALKTLDINARINGTFGRKPYFLKRNNNRYQMPQQIYAHGWIGLELFGHDKMNNSPFKYSLNSIMVKVDGKKTFTLNVDRIPHEINRAMNVHIDYQSHLINHKSFQRLYIVDGNPLKIYQSDKNKGKIYIQDGKTYNIAVIVKDDRGNASTLNFKIIGKKYDNADFIASSKPLKASVKHSVLENTLKIEAYYLKSKGKSALLFFNGIMKKVPLAYQKGDISVYLWDLRKAMPDGLKIGKINHYFHFKKMIPSGINAFYENKNTRIDFPKDALFDTLYLEFQQFNHAFQISSPLIPLMKNIKIKHRLSENNKKLYAFLGTNFLGGIWNANIITCETKHLGYIEFLEDVEKPSIKITNPNPSALSFRIKDKLSGIKAFKASINNKFIPVDYEHKSHLLTISPRNREKVQGKFILEVWDNAGNKSVYEKVF